MNDILIYFPTNIRNLLYNEIKNEELLEEIRIRINKPIILKFNKNHNVAFYF